MDGDTLLEIVPASFGGEILGISIAGWVHPLVGHSDVVKNDRAACFLHECLGCNRRKMAGPNFEEGELPCLR